MILRTKLQMTEESVKQILNLPVIKSHTWDYIQSAHNVTKSAGNDALFEAKLQGVLISSHHGARKQKYFHSTLSLRAYCTPVTAILHWQVIFGWVVQMTHVCQPLPTSSRITGLWNASFWIYRRFLSTTLE